MPRRKKADKKLPATPVVEEFQIPVCSVGKVNDDISRIMQETLTSICLNPGECMHIFYLISKEFHLINE